MYDYRKEGRATGVYREVMGQVDLNEVVEDPSHESVSSPDLG